MTSRAGAQSRVVRVSVRGGRFVPVVVGAVEGAAVELGFGGDETSRITRATRELFDAVTSASFDDPSQVDVEVEVLEGPASLHLRVADHGLPFSLSTDGVVAALTERLSSLPIDALRIRHEDDGDTVELELRRATDPGRPGPGQAAPGSVPGDLADTEPVGDDAAVTVRPLQREDCESLARCVWRVYGYTYVAHYLYDPDAVWGMVRAGRLRSAVGLDAEGEVIGHIGLLLDQPDQRVGDMSLALTDPRYRHHHVMESVGAALADAMSDLTLVGTFAEAVTTHTITQRGMVRRGGVETGVLLGFIPATMSYRGIAEDLGGNRQSAVLGYTAVRPAPRRRVVLPTRYRDLMASLYERLALDRELVDVAPDSPASLGPTRLSVEADTPRRLATIVVDRAGDDLVAAVEHQRAALCRQGVEIVYLEAPLDSGVVAQAVPQLREHGFFYAGFIPELRDGDVLRLQYLDVDVDPAPIQLYSDEAKRLLDLTLADQP